MMSYTRESLHRMQLKAAAEHKSTAILIRKLRRIQPKKLDRIVHDFHNREFEQIDCLECANCCKTISPAMHESDLRRLGQVLKMKTADLISEYLILDEDEEYVFRLTPCPFLGSDNYCSIYESRPKACRKYPHTDRKRFHQILDLTAKNSIICPVVFNIIEKIRKAHSVM